MQSFFVNTKANGLDNTLAGLILEEVEALLENTPSPTGDE